MSDYTGRTKDEVFADMLVAQAENLLELLRSAVNSSCSCGGSGPDDEGACPACRVWHRVLDDIQGGEL